MRITSRFQTRSASSIILKLTLNYNKMFEYSQMTLSGAAPIKINNSRQIPLSRIEQFISNFHESHRSKYRFNDWTEEKWQNRWETCKTNISAVPKKKGNYRKIQRPAALIIDIYPLWIVSPPHESLESRAR